MRTMLGGQDPGGSGGGGARRQTEVCGAFFNTFLPFFILRSFSFNSLLPIPFYWAPKKVRFLAYSAAKNVTVQAGRRRICLVVVRADATRGMFEPQHATTRHTARPPQTRVHVSTNKSQGMIMGAAVGLGTLSLSGGERRRGVSALREFLSRKVARPIEPYANPNLGRDGDNCQGLFQREKFHCRKLGNHETRSVCLVYLRLCRACILIITCKSQLPSGRLKRPTCSSLLCNG